MVKKATAKKSVATRNVSGKTSGDKEVRAIEATVGSFKKAVAKRGADPPPKRAGGATLTVTDIGEHLASTFDIPKSHAKIYVAEAVALIVKHLRKGNTIRISGLGVFEVTKGTPGEDHDLEAKDMTKTKAGKRIVFRPAQDLAADR